MIALLILLYFAIYATIVHFIPINSLPFLIIKVLMGGGAIVGAIIFIKVYIERLKEIKEEDDDDLSKY